MSQSALEATLPPPPDVPMNNLKRRLGTWDVTFAYMKVFLSGRVNISLGAYEPNVVCLLQLLAVVSQLQHQGLTILVLGRRHMLQPSRFWVKHEMDLIRQKAHCFFTENM